MSSLSPTYSLPSFYHDSIMVISAYSPAIKSSFLIRTSKKNTRMQALQSGISTLIFT
jgi:hypothetical protein